MKYDITYCNDYCNIGKAEKERCIEQNNSVFDAISDFLFFTEKCSKTCLYINENKLNNE